jgi:hypothetical protein
MGAAPEVVEDREVGVLVGAGKWDEMVAAIENGWLDGIDPHRCREHVKERFSVKTMLAGYEAAFEKILIETKNRREHTTVPEALPGTEQAFERLRSRTLVHDGQSGIPRSP